MEHDSVVIGDRQARTDEAPPVDQTFDEVLDLRVAPGDVDQVGSLARLHARPWLRSCRIVADGDHTNVTTGGDVVMPVEARTSTVSVLATFGEGAPSLGPIELVDGADRRRVAAEAAASRLLLVARPDHTHSTAEIADSLELGPNPHAARMAVSRVGVVWSASGSSPAPAATDGTVAQKTRSTPISLNG